MEKLTETDNWRLVGKLYEGEMEGKQPRGRPHKRRANNLLLVYPHCSKRYIYPCSGQPLRVTLFSQTSNKKFSIYRLTSFYATKCCY